MTAHTRAGLALTALMLVAACDQTAQEVSQPVEPADIVFTGENIVTVDPTSGRATGVAVRGDTIVAVGTAEEVGALVGEETRVVDLGDNALVPGFIDSHGHVTFYARIVDFVNLSSPPVGDVENFDDIVSAIRAYIEGNEIAPGEWVIGYGYDDSLLAENAHPDRAALDRASSEHPIYLMHVSGHLGAANSLALESGGITADTPDPAGGVIRRIDETGEPNGVLEETAAMPFMFRLMQQLSAGRMPELMARAIDVHASYGITTIQEGGLSLSDLAMLRDASAANPFVADVVGFPTLGGLDDLTLASIQYEPVYTSGFRVGGIKLWLDGSPQGRTAFMTEPYTEGPPGAPADYVAYPTYLREKYEQQIANMIDRGVPVLVHANGDAAMDMMIDGVEKAVAGREMPDHRSVIIHAQLMRDDQLDEALELGIVPSFFSAHAFFWGDWHRRSFGEERAMNISPMKAALEKGVHFTVHNDAPVVPPDIMRLIWASVNRTTRSGYVLGPHQRLTPLEALHAVTLGGAYQYFEEDRKGSITVGKQADLVVLGANPLTAAPDAIKDIPVLETIARGVTIFAAE